MKETDKNKQGKLAAISRLFRRLIKPYDNVTSAVSLRMLDGDNLGRISGGLV